jgi:hypothetical protein
VETTLKRKKMENGRLACIVRLSAGLCSTLEEQGRQLGKPDNVMEVTRKEGAHGKHTQFYEGERYMGNTGEYTHAQSTRTRGHHRDSSDSAAMNEPHLLRRQLLSHSPLRCVYPLALEKDSDSLYWVQFLWCLLESLPDL